MIRAYGRGPGRPTPFDGFARREGDFAFSTRARRRFAGARKAAIGRLIEARAEEGAGGRASASARALRRPSRRSCWPC